jgi:hypothetical protein
MPATTGAFPYNIDNLLGGAVRILFADPTADDDPGVPASIADVIDMKTPYAPKVGWTDLGATKESFNYHRAFEVEGWEIQQLAGNVVQEITSITRTIELSVAEFRPETLVMIENAPAIADVAAAAGKSAQKRVGFGNFQSLQRYRWAFISRRSKASGLVSEAAAPGSLQRGRFFMGVLYQAQVSADDLTVEQAKGALTASGITFTSFPEPTEPEGEEYGAWYDEQAGVIG